jgi:starch synthase
MKIVHAASELFPFIKTGGLADAVGALTRSLAASGHEIAVFLPGYRAVLDHPEIAGAERIHTLGIEMEDQFYSGEVLSKKLGEHLTLYLICRDEFFDRRSPYGTSGRDYEDNGERFIFFSKAVVEVLGQVRFKADIVHCHDWQTALVPLFLRLEEGRRGTLLAGKTILTIHNLAFQGIFPMRLFPLTNLPDELRGVDGLEYYGQVNFLKAGILFSDWISTVSPTYAREILTPRFGCGLEGVLTRRKDDLFCQINGIDYEVWDPEKDAYLPARYSAAKLEGKYKNQEALLAEMKLKPKGDGPVFGMICRFTQQKGMDLLREVIGAFTDRDCRLIVLGGGNPDYERWLRDLADAHPEKIGLSIGMNEKLSHLIEAGSDFFLMPSIFEPCGLNQMYSMRYGTLPLASQVGGLADTVIDIDGNPAEGTGLSFPPTREGFQDGIERAYSLYKDKDRMKQAIDRAMKRDFSWDRAAAGYERLYESAL